VNQHTPAHHGGWMDGHETVSYWVPVSQGTGSFSMELQNIPFSKMEYSLPYPQK